MKVRELLQAAARLVDADPEATVLFDRASRCWIVISIRPGGMHQPMDVAEEAGLLHLTEQDKQFLRAMRIPY